MLYIDQTQMDKLESLTGVPRVTVVRVAGFQLYNG